jgi:hypothetical protein
LSVDGDPALVTEEAFSMINTDEQVAQAVAL